jgi:hypothetical protein
MRLFVFYFKLFLSYIKIKIKYELELIRGPQKSTFFYKQLTD